VASPWEILKQPTANPPVAARFSGQHRHQPSFTLPSRQNLAKRASNSAGTLVLDSQGLRLRAHCNAEYTDRCDRLDQNDPVENEILG
jgi:hypothetical protein